MFAGIRLYLALVLTKLEDLLGTDRQHVAYVIEGILELEAENTKETGK